MQQCNNATIKPCNHQTMKQFNHESLFLYLVIQKDKNMLPVVIVSDGTGHTAQQALKAALTQFPGIETNIIFHQEVTTKQQVYDAVKNAKENNAIIVHTLVKEEIRNSLIRYGRKNNVETIDLMGPLLSRLSYQLANAPSEKPGLLYQLNREYFNRIDTMQFAFKHDDGLREDQLNKAEIILLGVSRTFKTPLSIYLAFKGWFVANIPIVNGINPPKNLLKVPPEKIFCLTTSPHHLSALRKFREEYLGKQTGNYASYDFVKREVAFANNYFLRNPQWSIIKVTSKPIEEIASEILAIRGKQERHPLL